MSKMGTHDLFGHLQHKVTKRKARNQIDNLTPDHGKSGINPIPLRAGGVQHAIKKFSTRATTSV
jgi:hypothetical protein